MGRRRKSALRPGLLARGLNFDAHAGLVGGEMKVNSCGHAIPKDVGDAGAAVPGTGSKYALDAHSAKKVERRARVPLFQARSRTQNTNQDSRRRN